MFAKLKVDWKSISCSALRTGQGFPARREASAHSVDFGNGLLLVLVLGFVAASVSFFEVLELKGQGVFGEVVRVLKGLLSFLDLSFVQLMSLALVHADHDHGVEDEESGGAETNNHASEGSGAKTIGSPVSVLFA